jgi:dipeptidyl aminopeptidase/acylaminoacyl peptidase
MIFFQGLDDKVVPPSQTEKMVAALADKGLPYAYLTFEGEGHGFRGSKTIQQSLEAELYFYSVLLGIPVDSSIAPVEIHNIELGDR